MIDAAPGLGSSLLHGHVANVHDRFGFIRGDDGRDYFFLPSSCDPRTIYQDLRPQHCVLFAPYYDSSRGAKGWRARGVVRCEHSHLDPAA